jgi:hypothetical protein
MGAWRMTPRYPPLVPYVSPFMGVDVIRFSQTSFKVALLNYCQIKFLR